jgi:ATP/ADP translocase
MAIAMALHFGGYEFARSSNLALFTSPETGFTRPFAFPLAMALASPFSFLLLMGYNRALEDRGPRIALRNTTLWSIAAIGMSALLFALLEQNPIYLFDGLSVSKILVGIAFVFQNSYAHLLYTQQWSFLGSVSSVETGARYFASIAGLSSLASTCSGSMVSVLVQQVGLYGLLACTVVTLSLSLLCAEQAYRIAQQHNFDPGDEIRQQQLDKALKKQEAQHNLVTKASQLFQRVPTLKALFCEVLSFQSMSTILNVCFVSELKATITDDIQRAAWTGRFYSSVNAVSAAFQFILMPLFMNKFEPRTIWKLLPIVPLGACIFTSLQPQSSLMLLALAFFSAKCLDYSVRGVVTELIYLPLDFESRFVGKELVSSGSMNQAQTIMFLMWKLISHTAFGPNLFLKNGVFGNRLGKSGMSVFLSVFTAVLGPAAPLKQLSTAAAICWASCSFWLSALLPRKEDAREAVKQRRALQEQQDPIVDKEGKKKTS